MKSANELLAHLIAVLTDIYKHPEMYAETPSELNSAFFYYYSIWGFITECDSELIICQTNLDDEFGFEITADSFYERINRPDISAFQSTLAHWK